MLTILDHAINHLKMPQAVTAARSRHVMRDVGHALHATSNHNVIVTCNAGIKCPASLHELRAFLILLYRRDTAMKAPADQKFASARKQLAGVWK
jgi:hypothetical protein